MGITNCNPSRIIRIGGERQICLSAFGQDRHRRLIQRNANPIINPYPSECLSTSLSCRYGVWRMDYGLPGGLYINITDKYQMMWCCEIRGARDKRCITSPPPPFTVQVTFILSQNEWDDSLIPHFRVARIRPNFKKDGA